MTRLFKAAFYLGLFLVLNLVIKPIPVANALDLKRVIAQEQGYGLTTKHILAFFAYLQNEGEMGDDPTEDEINAATNVAKQTFKQNPQLFIEKMEQILDIQQQPNPQASAQKTINNNSSSLQQEALKLYPQYKLKIQSADINTMFGIVSGKRFSNLKTESRRSGKFVMSSDFREDIHFCNSGRILMISHSKTAGGGEKALFSSGDSGGEVTIDGTWSLAQLPNNSGILILKMGQNPATLIPIYSDRVNIQMDNKVYSAAGQAGC